MCNHILITQLKKVQVYWIVSFIIKIDLVQGQFFCRPKSLYKKSYVIVCYQICLLRLGRACKLEGDTAGDGHVKDDPFPDRLHW